MADPAPIEYQRDLGSMLGASPGDLTPALQQQIGSAIDDLIEKISTPWFNAFLRYDPRPTLARVGCPVLALNGELDLQVTCAENLAGVSAALEHGGNSDATVRAFPDLNHPFQHCKTGHVDEYAQIDETISVEILEVITEWIAARFLVR